MTIITTTLLALTLCASHARAQPSGRASAEADTLFAQGRQLMDEKRFPEACNAFDASQKLAPAIATLFNQAHCREQTNQLATAWGLFREAERQTRAPLDDATQALHRVAVERAKELEPRLSKLTISVPQAHVVPGIAIIRGDVPVEQGAWNRALPIDGGTYAIVVRAPDHVDATVSITVASERDTQAVEIPRLAKVPPKPQVAKPAPRQLGLPIALGVTGLALLGGAVGLDLVARGQYRDAEREVDDARQRSLWSGAKTKRFVAQGLAVAGLGCVGTAIWLYVRRSRPAIEVTPVIGEQVGIQLVGSY